MEHLVGDEILAGAVALHDGLNQILRHVAVVGQELLRVLRQAIAAIAERGIVVERADAGIETDALDDVGRAQALHLGIGVQLIEIAHAEGQVGVGEELHGLCLRDAHEQRVDVLLDGTLLQKGGKRVGSLVETLVVSGTAHDDARGIEVVVERLALAQELGGEDDVVGARLPADGIGVAHRNGRLDHHDGIRIHLHDQPDHLLDMRRVEIVLHRVIVGRCGDDDKLRAGIGLAAIERGMEVELFLAKVFLDVFVLDG